ncbi:Solute carrier family 35 member G1 [Holothuria leucospilota]|uniref:Solute carrier family 35 member G1 n=1 Tax=Holothuria leucospilota TaxID=206669 RepID=A0A9Q0YMV2_HOLLE|nr:Solute carrier family 35 member G1 [Holothuria leucospilota]
MESDRTGSFFALEKNVRDRLLGILFSLLCTISFSTEDVLLYVLVKDFHPCLILLFNSTVSFTLCILLDLTLKPQRPTTIKQFLLVIILGGLNCIGQVATATAIFAIGPGSAVSLLFTSPIFTTAYSVLFLRTKLQVKDVFFAICSTFGVSLLTRYLTLIEDQALTDIFLVVFGSAIAIVGAMAFAGTLIVGRKVAYFETHSLVIILSYSFQYSIVAIVLCSAFNAWQTPKTLPSLVLLLGTGLTTFGGMLFGYLAVCYEKPTVVAVLLTTEVIMTFIGQFAILNFPFHWTVTVGSALILFSCVGILLFQSHDDEDNYNEHGHDDESGHIVKPSNSLQN